MILVQHFSGFQDLNFDDQRFLIQNNWPDVLIFNVAYNTYNQLHENPQSPHKIYNSVCVGSKFVFSSNENKTTEKNHVFLNKFVNIVRNSISKMNNLKVTADEFEILKAMAILAKDTSDLTCKVDAHLLYDSYYQILVNKTESNYPNDYGRLLKLILILPVVRIASCQFVKLLNEVITPLL